MPINLGTYHQDNPDDSPDHYTNERLSWRQLKDDSFSDWTIIVKHGDTATHYHVHKNLLGVGPRRSEYFKRLFCTKGLAESETKTSEVALEKSAAEAFPIMLDFIYSPEGKLEATTELATALRYLANYFGIRDLFSKVNEFIQDDVTIDNVSIYWKEASLYKDEALLEEMKTFIAQNFENFEETTLLLEISPTHFDDVVSSPQLKCGSELLSKRVAAYMSVHEEEISDHSLRSFTRPNKMPRLAPETAIFFAKADAACPQNSNEGDEPTLFSRCVDALIKSGSTNYQGRMDEQEEYKNLPKDNRLSLLEETLHRTRQENNEKITELKNKNEKLKKKIKKLKKQVPREGRVVVHGAGIASVNGVYAGIGAQNLYMKEGTWEGQEGNYILLRDRQKCWYIFFRSDDSSHTVIYAHNKPSKTVPKSGWQGQDGYVPPPPLCILLS